MSSPLAVRFVVSPFLQATCCVLHEDQQGGAALIIDPGFDVAPTVQSYLDAGELEPVGLAVTHGHLDHVADAARLAADWDVPVHVGRGDSYRLDCPIDQLPDAFTGAIRPVWEQLGWQRPAQVRELAEEDTIQLGAHRLTTTTLPGHTEGSTIICADTPVRAVPAGGITDGLAELHEHGIAFTGDILFRGSIGRTDLPGGSSDDMLASLRRLRALAEQRRAMTIVPGHGPASAFGRELTDNRFLSL